MPLPPKKLADGSDNPAWLAEVKAYQASTPEWRDNRASELDYGTTNAYVTVMGQRKVYITKPDIPTTEGQAEPETPVTITSLFLGILISIFLRLCSRAPLM